MNQQQLDKQMWSESQTIAGLENYMKNEPGESVIILDRFDLLFSRSELAEIKRLWMQGVSLPIIAKKLKRDENEVFLALFHLTFYNDGRKGEGIAIRISQIKGDAV
ncbi:hypothetical protein [Evansella clarkii]|uniref:hypothetical protein n=1 Tax=Evansella clarkii TaxID=79879 RepID=UPI00099780D6|nr:hypothetical protein [Evansella clarkii]